MRDLLYLFPGLSLPFGWSWPNGATEVYPWIFNIADSALVCGVVVMTGLMWRHRDRTGASVRNATDDPSASR